MNSTLTGAVAMYLSQVRAELSDLPPGELADVTEDVSGHLSEVAAEFGSEPTIAALHERLGTPRQYADELRTAAGYPPRTTKAPSVQDPARKALRWGVIASTVGPFFVLVAIFSGGEAVTAFFGFVGFAILFGAAYLGVRALGGNDPRIVLDTPRGQSGERSIRELVDQIPPNVRKELITIGQPVWWVLRGAVGGGGFFLLFGAGPVAVVGALVGAVVSVWVARRTQQDRRWLWYVVPLNVVATIVVPAFFAAAFMGTSSGIFAHDRYDNSVGTSYATGLMLDGVAITNIYPFDAQGKQVAVTLYTQDGKPIDLPLEDCATNNNTNSGPASSNIYPHAIATTLYPTAEPTNETEPPADPPCTDDTKAPFTPPQFPATTKPTPTPAATTKPSIKPSVTLTVQPTR